MNTNPMMYPDGTQYECGCIQGERLCQYAENMWHLVNSAWYAGNMKVYDRIHRQYDLHLAEREPIKSKQLA